MCGTKTLKVPTVDLFSLNKNTRNLVVCKVMAYAKKFAPKYGSILKGMQEAIDAGCLDEGKLYIILGKTVFLKMFSLKNIKHLNVIKLVKH